MDVSLCGFEDRFARAGSLAIRRARIFSSDETALLVLEDGFTILESHV
jgi:hypothetical protein